MISEILTKSNTNLLIIVLCMFIILRSSKYINLFEQLFLNLRLYISKSVNDSSSLFLTRISEVPQSNIERLSEKKFANLQLSLLKLDTNIHKLSFIQKQSFYSFYKTILVLFYAILFSQFFSQIYHCFYSDLLQSPLSSWNILLPLFTVIINYRYIVHILLITPYASFEFKFSLAMGFISLLISISFYLLNNYPGAPYLLPSHYLELTITKEIETMSNHFNALLSLFSETKFNLSNETIATILYSFIIFQTSLITSCITLVTLKLTQISHYLFFESKLDKMNTHQSIVLFLDFVLPLILFLVFAPKISSYLSSYMNIDNHYSLNHTNVNNNTCTASSSTPNDKSKKNSRSTPDLTSNTCSAITNSNTTFPSLYPSSLMLWSYYDNTSTTNSMVFMLQIICLIFAVIIRFLCIKIYLQGYFDKTTYYLWHMIKLVHTSSLSTFSNYAREKMKLCHSQLVMNTCLLLNYPVALVCLCALLLRLTPGCTAVCKTLLSWSQPPAAMTQYETSVIQLYNYNATQHALDAVGPPYFDDAMVTFLMSVGNKHHTVAGKLLVFIKKISELPVLPADVTVNLIKKGISIFSLVSFIVNIICVLYWLYKDIVGVDTTTSSSSSSTQTPVTTSVTTDSAADSTSNSQDTYLTTDKHATTHFPLQIPTTKPTTAEVEALAEKDQDFQNMSKLDSKVNPVIKSNLQ